MGEVGKATMVATVERIAAVKSSGSAQPTDITTAEQELLIQ